MYLLKLCVAVKVVHNSLFTLANAAVSVLNKSFNPPPPFRLLGTNSHRVELKDKVMVIRKVFRIKALMMTFSLKL